MDIGTTKQGKDCKKCGRKNGRCSQHASPIESPISNELTEQSPRFSVYEDLPPLAKQQIMLNMNYPDLIKLISVSKSSEKIANLPNFRELYELKHPSYIYGVNNKNKLYDARIVSHVITDPYTGKPRKTFVIGGYTISSDGIWVWKERRVTKDVLEEFKISSKFRN